MAEIDTTLLRQLSRLQVPGCPSIAELGALLDEQIPPEERQSLEAHVQACPVCMNRLIDLRELALFSQEPDFPPPALREKLQRTAERLATGEQASLSAWERLTAVFSTVWATGIHWTSARFAREILATAAIAVFLLFFIPSVLLQQPTDSLPDGAVIQTVDALAPAAQNALQSLVAATTGTQTFQQQMRSILEKLPKNLLLEETRGATNVAVYRNAAPATVLVVTDKSLGSGAVISDQGHVITNWHVVAGASGVAVVFKPQRGVEVKQELAFAAIPVKVDQVADLALLQILAPPKNLPVLPLGSMTDIAVGEDVHAIGHPDGEVWTYTTGIISQVRPRYQWASGDGLQHQSDVIQTQTALNPGNSGGPLLNDRGEIIGINSFRREGQGLNYAVAVDVVKAFLQREGGRVATPAPRPRPTSRRMEHYGEHIVGVYVNTSLPPPDVWMVYREKKEQPAYAAKGSAIPTQIDTIVLGADPAWNSLVYYLDADCNGVIDLIGFDSNSDGTIDRYDLPREPFPLVSLAGELSQAIQRGTIPYSRLRMCGR